MKLEDKIKELEDKKKSIMTSIMDEKVEKEVVGDLLDEIINIKYAISQLKEVDNIEEEEDDYHLNVDAYIEKIKTESAHHTMGSTTYDIQRKLVTKIEVLKNKTLATKLITNGNMAAVLGDVAGYTLTPINAGRLNQVDPRIPYPMGQIGNLQIFVDAFQRWDDNRIVLYANENEVATLIVKDTQGVLI